MNTKFIKLNPLSLGVFSAISASLLLLVGTPVNAQTGSQNNSGTLNQSPNQTDNPNQLNSPQTEINGNPTLQNQTPNQPNTTPNQQNTTPNSPSQGVAPNTSSPLSNYSTNQAPNISYGSRGQTVRDVQTFLSQQGLYNGSIDGIYGPQTRNAVISFQRSRNLIADGVIGPRTWNTMLNGRSEASAF